MSRRLLALVLVGAALAFAWSHLAVPARAGGGCHGGPVRDVAGTTVDMRGACFDAAVLRVAVGQLVTWTNSDSVEHTVTGVASSWGDYDAIPAGGSVGHRFENAGVYPYFCLFHPGMIGAIVVGDGGAVAGAGAGDPGTTAPATDASTAAPGPATTLDLGALILAIMALVAIAGGAGVGLARLARVRRATRRSQTDNESIG